jgi:hypothetical protein
LSARDAIRSRGLDEIVPGAIVAIANRDLVIAALFRRDGDGARWCQQLENQSGVRGER